MPLLTPVLDYCILEVFHLQRGGNLHTPPNSAGHWTVVSVEAVNPFGRGPMVGGQFQMVGDVNTPDNQDIILFFNFAGHIRG